jgi:hypothetical protein
MASGRLFLAKKRQVFHRCFRVRRDEVTGHGHASMQHEGPYNTLSTGRRGSSAYEAVKRLRIHRVPYI